MGKSYVCHDSWGRVYHIWGMAKHMSPCHMTSRLFLGLVDVACVIVCTVPSNTFILTHPLCVLCIYITLEVIPPYVSIFLVLLLARSQSQRRFISSNSSFSARTDTRACDGRSPAPSSCSNTSWHGWNKERAHLDNSQYFWYLNRLWDKMPWPARDHGEFFYMGGYIHVWCLHLFVLFF